MRRSLWLPLIIAAGVYVLQLTDDDGELTASDQLTVTVTSASIIRVPEDQPTIQAGIDAAQDGDWVLVSPGTYYERLTLAGKTITLASRFHTTQDPSFIDQTIIDGGGRTVITVASSVGPETKIIGLTIQNGNDGISASANLHILHNHFTGNDDAIDYEGGGGICRNNVFENNSDDAVDLDGPSEALIENNVIRNCSDDGIEIRLHAYSGTTLNIIIRGNTISGNAHDGIQLIDYPDLSDRFFLIEHNLIEGNGMAGLGLMDNGDTQEDYRAASIPEPIHLFNNTFSGNDHGLSGGDNLIALNNLFVDSTQLGVKGLDGDSIAAYNLFWNNGTDYQNSNVDLATTLFADPLLDAEYHLPPGSPAIDAGTAHFEWGGETVLDLPPSAYNGAAPDLGCFESDSVTTSYDLALSPGWNLVSWPLAPLSDVLTDTLASCSACDQAWAYDAWDGTDPWKEWPGDLAQVDETMGLWLHATDIVTLPVAGWPPASPTIELRAGWNLVGYPSQTARSVAEALSSIAGQYTRVATFDATDPAGPWQEYDVDLPPYANDMALMEPGRGYWVEVTEDCTWIVEP